VWKRCGSDKPQQSAAAKCDSSLAERHERQAAVDRSSCSRLTSRRSPVRAGHRPLARVRLRSETATSRYAHGHVRHASVEALWKRRGSPRQAVASSHHSVGSLWGPSASRVPRSQRMRCPALSRGCRAVVLLREPVPTAGALPSWACCLSRRATLAHRLRRLALPRGSKSRLALPLSSGLRIRPGSGITEWP
jgi:hypothetical protein